MKFTCVLRMSMHILQVVDNVQFDMGAMIFITHVCAMSSILYFNSLDFIETTMMDLLTY